MNLSQKTAEDWDQEISLCGKLDLATNTNQLNIHIFFAGQDWQLRSDLGEVPMWSLPCPSQLVGPLRLPAVQHKNLEVS